jgi:peptidoglycan/LPS O-acetylase OafA/YrhL
VNAKRFYELDLLRFVAAFSVVLFHYSFRAYAADGLSPLPYLAIAPVTKYGFMGVDLFFLISGFVILMTASGGSKRHFVVSRVVRLYPAFWTCCTATFVVSLFVAKMRHVTLHDYLINLTMLSGFIDVPSVDSVYWSLFIEIRFYFIVFLVLLFRQLHRMKMLLGVWLALFAASSLYPIKILSFLLIPVYAPYFIAGSMFFLISREGFSLYKGGVIAACFGLIAVHAARSLGEMRTHFHTPFSAAVIIGLLAVFFALLFLVATGRTESLGNKKWLALGALTYPLYLIHQNIGYAAFNIGYGSINPHVLMWGVVAAMLLAAHLVNRVERVCARPMRDALLRLIPAGSPKVAPPPAPT